MDITITRKIDPQTITDVMITALEGGSNYWYMTDVEQIEGLIRENGETTTEAIGFSITRNPEFKMPVWDLEEMGDGEPKIDGDGFLGFLTPESVKKAFETMPPSRLSSILEEEYDADDADVFFQYAVMGEIVFG